jgi:hypothetical protein
MDIKKLLSECSVIPSTITKTGKFYVKDNVVILEHMGTNKNIWVDDEFANKFNDSKKLDTEIREFFNGKVKSIMTLPINKEVKDFKDKVIQICKDNNFNVDDVDNLIADYRKIF